MPSIKYAPILEFFLRQAIYNTMILMMVVNDKTREMAVNLNMVWDYTSALLRQTRKDEQK
jgi:hypothetical protein